MIYLDNYRDNANKNGREIMYLHDGRTFTIIDTQAVDGRINFYYPDKFGKLIKLIEITLTDQDGQYDVYVAGNQHDATGWYNENKQAGHEPMPDFLPRRKRNTVISILYDLLKKENFKEMFGKDLYDLVYEE